MKTRESRYVKVARIAYHLTQEALPRYSHPKSPHHFTLPQLAACVLLMFYLDLSYRDMEEWLLASDQVSQHWSCPAFLITPPCSAPTRSCAGWT